MMVLVGTGLGAGLVASLLFGAVSASASAGMLLCYAAPLPIAIVALGWHRRAGLLAVWTGAFLLSLVLRPSAGIAFAVGPGLPVWILSCLALVWRPDPASPDGGHWLGAGTLLLAASVFGAALAFAAAIALGGGSFDGFAGLLRRVTESILRAELGPARPGTLGTVAGVPRSSLVSFLVAVAPAVAASVFSFALALNLWLGAKATALSGRLPRPLPLLSELRMPVSALWTLGVGSLLAFAPGFGGVAGLALVGALTMTFALQGLSCLHAVTRGRPGRGLILTLAYILTIFFGGTFLPLMALAGMLDTATPIRRRLSQRGRPPLVPPKE